MVIKRDGENINLAIPLAVFFDYSLIVTVLVCIF